MFWANVAIAVILDDELASNGIDGMLSQRLFGGTEV